MDNQYLGVKNYPKLIRLGPSGGGDASSNADPVMPCTVGAVRGKMRSTTLRHMPETQTPAHLVAKSFSGSWVVILSYFIFDIFVC